jgi:hypothetical protein
MYCKRDGISQLALKPSARRASAFATCRQPTLAFDLVAHRLDGRPKIEGHLNQRKQRESGWLRPSCRERADRRVTSDRRQFLGIGEGCRRSSNRLQDVKPDVSFF